MIRIHRLWLLGIALLFAFAAAPISVSVSPRVTVSWMSDLVVTATAERHPDNRTLVLEVSGPEYRRQDIALNTDPDSIDARIHQRWFKGVRSGHYTVVATVLRTQGKSVRAETTACISGPETSCTAEGR